jgi:hypothetical protein
MPVTSQGQRLRVPSLIGLACLLATLGLAAGTARAASPASFVRIGAAPVLPAGTEPLAAAASSERLRVTIALAPRNAAALSAYANSVANPASPDYRHYLRPAAFAVRFGPTSVTIAAVRRALRAAGLRPGALEANHLSFDVVADAAGFERAMHLELAHVRLPDGTAALIDLEAPAVPSAVANDIQAVIGLDGLQTMRSNLDRASASAASAADATATALKSPAVKPATVKPATVKPVSATAKERKHQSPEACAAAASTGSQQGAYTANQIASAYSFDGLYAADDEGAQITVGVYELESDDTNDIAAYQACYGTDTSVTYQPVDGGAGTGPGSGEAAFDIEQLIGLAPKANLIVYQAPNSNSDSPGSGPYDLFADIISADTVSIISNSWGECEAVEGAADAAAENALFEEAAIQGQSIVSAAGDDGAEDCLGAGATPNYALAVDDPGSQPFVTDVGGTSLTALGPPPTEVTWNSGGGGLAALGISNGAGAGGGGISTLWPMPSYQSGAPASLNIINGYSSGKNCGDTTGDCREVPDVSADADPQHGYLIYYNGAGSVAGPKGWQATGGTSGAAPLWAALFALTNADSACDRAPIGFANPALYRAAAAGETTYFQDVTSGDNDFTGTNHELYPATSGYDMATGLGTPNATALATELCEQSLRLTAPVVSGGFVIAPTTSIGSGAAETTGDSFLGTEVSLSLRIQSPAGVSVGVTVTGLPRGVSFDTTTNTISGAPAVAGIYSVKVTAGDSDGTVRTESLRWRVAARPSVNHLALSGVGAATPVLSLRLTAGRDETALRSVFLTLPAGLSLAKGADVTVRALSTGHVIGRSLRGSGARVAITLKTAGTPVFVRFAAGSLRATPALARAAARRPQPSERLTLEVKDSSGGISPLHRSVTATT